MPISTTPFPMIKRDRGKRFKTMETRQERFEQLRAEARRKVELQKKRDLEDQERLAREAVAPVTEKVQTDDMDGMPIIETTKPEPKAEPIKPVSTRRILMTHAKKKTISKTIPARQRSGPQAKDALPEPGDSSPTGTR